jgi:hypothetical protein
MQPSVNFKLNGEFGFVLKCDSKLNLYLHAK